MATTGNFLIPEEVMKELDAYRTNFFQVGSGPGRNSSVEFGNRRVRAYPRGDLVMLKYIRLGEGAEAGKLKERLVGKSLIEARKEIMQWLIQGLLPDGTRA